MLEMILQELWKSGEGMLKNDLGKILKVKSFTKPKYNPLIELALIEEIKIQITNTKPRTPNALKITIKGVDYLQYVTNSKEVNPSQGIKEANQTLARLSSDFRAIEKAFTNSQNELNRVQSFLKDLSNIDFSSRNKTSSS
ncbi:MAG: hypothetical protein IH840_16380 [Candidatus Heimdallarchaeota archaeon]|nr:hypothetical protein [Candidatus Heimdallarchaeota archaeon]